MTLIYRAFEHLDGQSGQKVLEWQPRAEDAVSVGIKQDGGIAWLSPRNAMDADSVGSFCLESLGRGLRPSADMMMMMNNKNLNLNQLYLRND